MKHTLVVTRYAYLKTCVNKWRLVNDVGGSFSNSGEYRSLRALGEHARANCGVASADMPVRFETIHGYDKDYNQVVSVVETYWAKMFGWKG